MADKLQRIREMQKMAERLEEIDRRPSHGYTIDNDFLKKDVREIREALHALYVHIIENEMTG